MSDTGYSATLRTGGVDPGIIRELSGTYKPFVKAFKEIISNSFDADATQVEIMLARDFDNIEVRDNGVGLTPFELQREYIKIGGSQTRAEATRSSNTGRARIGSKGTGFLAVARYASQVSIESTTLKSFELHLPLLVPALEDSRQLDILKGVELPVSPAQLSEQVREVRVISRRKAANEGKAVPHNQPAGYTESEANSLMDGATRNVAGPELVEWVEGKDYELTLLPISQTFIGDEPGPDQASTEAGNEPENENEQRQSLFLTLPHESNIQGGDELEVELTVDCRKFLLKAVIDYDYLISLEQQVDLQEIKDFCTIQIELLRDNDSRAEQQFTRVKVCRLKSFVVDYLKNKARAAIAYNIRGRSGVERFKWELSRCIPLAYQLPQAIETHFGPENLYHQTLSYIPTVLFTLEGQAPEQLYRPVFGTSEKDNFNFYPELCLPVEINEDGLLVRGYILGQANVINPAEFRGLTIRVRNVSIGNPGFLGAEDFLSGPSKAALSQITGEINILSGMDALNDLNPGRESFYEESPHYKLLRRHLIGDNSIVAGGKVGEVIRAILKRIALNSSAEGYLVENTKRRQALTTVAAGITQQARAYPTIERNLRYYLQAGYTPANRELAQMPDFPMDPPVSLSGYKVRLADELEHEYEIDHDQQEIRFDRNSEIWDWTITVLGRRLEIVLKHGGPDKPMCELDFTNNKIYLNWTHHIKANISAENFITTSLAWHIAYLGIGKDGRVEDLMSFALGVMAHND